MDAFPIVALVLSGVAWGVAGFLIGRLQRGIRDRRQSLANLARSNDRANRRALAVRHSHRLTFPDGVPDSDGDGDSDGNSATLRADVGSPRRRAIHGDNNWRRFDSGSAGGARRVTDETALAVAGYDC